MIGWKEKLTNSFMPKQRIRYQWFRDIPRNVTRREYERFQFRSFCAIGLGCTAAVMAIAALTGLTLKPAQDLAKVNGISVKEATAYQGEGLALIKLEGYLVADDAPAMPDDEARRVIRGALTLSARGDVDSGTTESEEPLRETLFEWEGAADAVFLSDGEARIPLAFDLAVLPMMEEAGELSPKVVRQGDSARTSRPVAVEYGEMSFPLLPATWDQADSVFTDLERSVLPHGQTVVVVASLEPTSQGNQLVDPLGDRLQVRLGSEQEIRQQGQQLRGIFLILCVPLGVTSFLLGRSSHRLWQEFIERSNQ
jgi:hypothetical protein